MRRVTDEEAKLINESKCPKCQSCDIDVYFAKASLDITCNVCSLTWSQFKDGKTVIW